MALDIYLGKWPAMTVEGVSVSKEQAAEILIRTNNWSYGTNDSEWRKQVCTVIGAEGKYASGRAYWEIDYDSLREAERRLGVISLGYLGNNQIMSCWIGGPHGWIAWDGTVGSHNYNIGKWPEAAEVYEEWTKIAAAFPYLDLTCQLWSEEVGMDGSVPLVEYVVRQGQVVMQKPRAKHSPPEDTPMRDIGFLGSERGCTLAQLKKAVASVKKKALGAP
jgi:hypothetical protein